MIYNATRFYKLTQFLFFISDTTNTSSRKPVSTSQRPSASTSVDIPPQGASAAAVGEVSTSKAR